MHTLAHMHAHTQYMCEKERESVCLTVNVTVCVGGGESVRVCDYVYMSFACARVFMSHRPHIPS